MTTRDALLACLRGSDRKPTLRGIALRLHAERSRDELLDLVIALEAGDRDALWELPEDVVLGLLPTAPGDQ